MEDLSREEERRGWRALFLWAIPIGLVMGLILMFAPSLMNVISPNRDGQDRVETREAQIGTTGPTAVALKRSAEVGPYLSDQFGRDLYLFDKDLKGGSDHAAASECYKECANFWPPLLTEGEPKPMDGVDAALLGTTERADKSTQVTYNGWPLYRFVRDVGPEQAKGHKLEDFGGSWYLVSPRGEKIGAAGQG